MSAKDIYVYFSGSFNNPDGTAKIFGNLGDISSYYIINNAINILSLEDKINLIPINQMSPQKNIEDITVISLIGSILTHIHTFKRNKNSVFLGCGSIDGEFINNTNFKNKILGVRGELSKNVILKNEDIEITSDFGLLLSEFYHNTITPTKKTGYIISSVDRGYFFKEYPHLKGDLVDNYEGIDVFLKQLFTYEKIVSSSLHGLIFSHSYGKPAIPIKLGDKIIGQDFKFEDYYTSLGMKNIKRIPLESKVGDFETIFDSNYDVPYETIEIIKQKQLKMIGDYLMSII